MERGGVFIYRFDDDQPDQVTQAAAVTLPSTEVSGRGIVAWLVDHLRRRGLSHERALRYQDHVAQGRRLVSVTVTTVPPQGSVVMQRPVQHVPWRDAGAPN